MRPCLRLALAVLLAAASLPAQNELGLFVGAGSTNRVVRTVDAVEELLTRIDADDFAGLGVDPAQPRAITVTGVRAAVFDFDRSTADRFHVVVRSEGAAANTPDTASPPLARVGPLRIASAQGAGSATFLVHFATPVRAPAGQDLFVGGEMSPFTDRQTNDGVLAFAVDGTGSAGAVHDLGGPAVDTTDPYSDTYAHAWVPSGPNAGLYDLARSYFLFEPVLFGAGGVCTAVTNQTSMASSAIPPGIASPFSGLHPDVAGFHPGRVDRPGFHFIDAAMAGQNVVIFISGFGLNPNPRPAAGFVPGSSGSLCVNDIGLAVAGLVADPNGVASLSAPIDPLARTAIGGSGVQLTWFAIAFDGTRLSSSPCVLQTY